MVNSTTQFSVFLVNKPGILTQVCDALAEKKINVVALTLMDSVEHGVFRLVGQNVDRVRSALQGINVPMTETEVLTVEMPNRPGAMADLCSRLNSEKISIKYAYVTSGAAGGRTIGIFKVNNLKKALRVADSRKPRRKERKVMRKAPGRNR